MRLQDEGGQMTISKLLSEIKTIQGALLRLWHKISAVLQLSSCYMLFPFPELLVWGPGMRTQKTCQQIPHNNKHGTDSRGMNYCSSWISMQTLTARVNLLTCSKYSLTGTANKPHTARTLVPIVTSLQKSKTIYIVNNWAVISGNL